MSVTAVLFEVESSPAAFSCGECGGFTGHFVPSSCPTKSPPSLNSASANVRTADDAADNPHGSMKKRAQYTKTKMCPYLGSVHGCYDGDACAFAHNPRELRRRPDLAKTRLCTDFTLKGSCRRGDRCDFAHGYRELKSTASYYKTDLCKFWTTGVCHSGYLCRHAHGVHELRRYEPPPPPSPNTAPPIPGGASSESTTDMSSGNNSQMHVKSKQACLGDPTDESRQSSQGRRDLATGNNSEEQELYVALGDDNLGDVDGGEVASGADGLQFVRVQSLQTQPSFSSRTTQSPPPPHIFPRGRSDRVPAAASVGSLDLHSLAADLAWLRGGSHTRPEPPGTRQLWPQVEFRPVVGGCDQGTALCATPPFIDPQLMNDPQAFSNPPPLPNAEALIESPTTANNTTSLSLGGFGPPSGALSRATLPNLYSKLRLMMIFPGPTVSCVVTGNQVLLDEKYSQAVVTNGTIFPQAQLVPPLLLNNGGFLP